MKKIFLSILLIFGLIILVSCRINVEEVDPNVQDTPIVPESPTTPDTPIVPETPTTPDTPTNPVDSADKVTITKSGGYFESAYVEWEMVSAAEGYNVYYRKQSEADSAYRKIDEMLVRQYSDHLRADVVGLVKGDYQVKVVPVMSGKEAAFYGVAKMTVTAHDRSGFAFSSKSQEKTASGAYNDDGSLKTGAQVIYVTAKTAKTVEAIVGGNKVKGLQAILAAKQKKNTSNDILDIRIIGLIKKSDLDAILSSAEGIQIKGNNSYTPMNITIEGIGEDATVHGFGFLVRNCANVEFRNFAIMNFMDDGISLDTDNCNIWIHNVDIFYGSTGSASDQVKGDGSIDIKGKSTYVTISYVHFWDSGKCSLCGMSDTTDFLVTYHHNWFDHSDSRHPRIRVASVHLYNNYFDGNSKYGVGTTKGSSAFVEANYFRNCANPMMSSKQGTDALGDGTFSGENGGMIKAYNNIIKGASSIIYANSDAGTKPANTQTFDAYLATTRSELVSSSYKTIAGGTSYNNFDTSSNYDLGVDSNKIDDPNDVPTIVTAYAGRMNGGDFKWEFKDEDDSSYAVDSALKQAIEGYTSTLIKIYGENISSTNPENPDSSDEPANPENPEITGSIVHNFTKDGKDSNFFNITGNLSTSKGKVTYNGLELSQCLKLETSTEISFTISQAMTIIIVLGNNGTVGQTVKIDEQKYTSDNNGIVTIELEAGMHIITKANTSNIFYIALIAKDE